MFLSICRPCTLGQYKQSNPKEYVEIVPHIKPGNDVLDRSHNVNSQHLLS
jgi:hypothetical protein